MSLSVLCLRSWLLVWELSLVSVLLCSMFCASSTLPVCRRDRWGERTHLLTYYAVSKYHNFFLSLSAFSLIVRDARDAHSHWKDFGIKTENIFFWTDKQTLFSYPFILKVVACCKTMLAVELCLLRILLLHNGTLSPSQEKVSLHGPHYSEYAMVVEVDFLCTLGQKWGFILWSFRSLVSVIREARFFYVTKARIFFPDFFFFFALWVQSEARHLQIYLSGRKAQVSVRWSPL